MDQARLKFVALLGSKDVVEVIGACIEHLRRIGVTLIIVTDYGSSDGTLEVLAEQEKRGDVWTFKLSVEVDYDTDRLRSERYVTLARESGADWALILDPDEFWLPISGSLHTLTELRDADLLKVETYRVVVSRERGYPDPSAMSPEVYDKILLYGRAPEMDRWPKVLVRPEAMAATTDGDHDVILTPARPWRRRVTNDLLVAHLPFTTIERFERKVANIRRFYQRNPEWFAKGLGTNWMDWMREADEGRMLDTFDRQTLDEVTIARMRQEGSLRSAADILANRRHERQRADAQGSTGG